MREVIGVNARDLESLEVDVDASLARLARIARDRLAVAESGICATARTSERAASGGRVCHPRR